MPVVSRDTSGACLVCFEPLRARLGSKMANNVMCPNCTNARAMIRSAAYTMMSLYGIPRASGICVDCKVKPAEHRDHRHYGLPLQVDYVCGPCNHRRGPALDLFDLIRVHRGLPLREPAPPPPPPPPPPTEPEPAPEPITAEPFMVRTASDFDQQVEACEQYLIRRALADCNGNRTKAAKQLGITFRTMRYRMQRNGIEE